VTEGTWVLALFSIFLTPLAAAGLALINAGLGRSRSAAHTMLASLCVIGVAALAYLTCGFAWQSFAAGASHTSLIAGKPWSWIGAGPLFLRGMLWDTSAAPLILLLGMFSAGLSATIPLGAGSDRWRLSASLLSTALFAGFTYPLFAHWVWGGGWLQQMGVNCGLSRGFLDTGGAAVIHVSGGLTALSIAWILGPRRGKYSDGMPAAIPGHNGILVLFGCLLALVGWLGLNAAGAVLFNGVTPGGGVVLVAVNTLLAAGAACLTTAALTRSRYGRPDASLCANGWVGGLVASSAIASLVNPLAAALIGTIAGALVARRRLSSTCCARLRRRHLGRRERGHQESLHSGSSRSEVLRRSGIAPHPDAEIVVVPIWTFRIGFRIRHGSGLPDPVPFVPPQSLGSHGRIFPCSFRRPLPRGCDRGIAGRRVDRALHRCAVRSPAPEGAVDARPGPCLGPSLR